MILFIIIDIVYGKIFVRTLIIIEKMMTESYVLITSAAFLGVVHTILGPDHYVPFIAIAKARQWNISKTALITLLCGIGHILSSVVIGMLGIILGWALYSVETFESVRGDIAGWLLIAFGIVYTAWGINRFIKKKPHKHPHYHSEGIFHSHKHSHSDSHSHKDETEKSNITPWALFIIFIFGPCEPLIPIVMYPAANHNYFLVIIVSLIFGITTIATMLILTFAGLYGLNLLQLNKLEKYIHLIAGITIILCGISVKFLGL
ncbi:MAG: sulfite exporter TauE/SafE family protein [bacterium]